jgi:molybdopterin-synthase adenylyltransferase
VSLPFSYADFTQRNLGFVTTTEQETLRGANVLVCGVGGMGGACLQSLVRAGIGGFALADFDRFEVSNMNRQVFANLESVGVEKVEATVAQVRRINPELRLETFGSDWVERLNDLLPRYPLVVNGMDDIRAGIALYRKARQHGATVIDAYAAPLPSVFVVRPADPRPEERFQAATRGRPAETLDDATIAAYFAREVEHIVVHSSSARHIDFEVARQMMAGLRKRPSFAPMVITTGNLMAFEAVKVLLGRPRMADARGYFFDPWALRVERPRPAAVAWVMTRLARRFLARLAR